MKHPKLLTILLKIYSFEWLRVITLPFRYVSLHVSRKFITISYGKKSLTVTPTPTPSEYPHEPPKEIVLQPNVPFTPVKTYFVYILRSLTNGKFYIGTTEDLYGCFARHNNGKNITTLDYRPYELIYYEASINYFDAKEREQYLRSNAGNKFLKKRLKRFLTYHPPSRIQRILKIARFVAIQVLLLLLPSLVAIMYAPHPSIAAWFDVGWAFRTSITITHNASVTYNKVKFDIDTQTLITNTKMQSDCGDSRFTDNNGNLLPYYLDATGGACNTNSTDYYVLIPVINNGTTVIYHYYGNPSALDGTSGSQLNYPTLTPSSGSSSGSEENGPGPISYWKLDEGADNTCKGGTNDVCDTASYKNDGVINTAKWRTEDFCVSGKCLYFDGSNDDVTVADNDTLDIPDSTNFSVSFWAKLSSLSADQALVAKKSTQASTTAGFMVFYNSSSGILDFRVADGTDQFIVSSTSFSTINEWVYITAVYDESSATNSTIYVNGKNVKASTTGTISNVNSLASTTALTMGTQGNGSSDYSGFLDDVKLYRYARSEAQIKTDLSSRGSIKGVAAQMGQQSTDYLSKGLVGYWKMDESSWNGTAGEVVDSSGNSNNGTSQNGVTTGTGRYGLGGNFDGSNDQVTAGDSTTLEPSGDISVSTWVNFSSLPSTRAEGAVLVGKYDTTANQESYYLEVNTSDALRFSWRDTNGTSYIAVSGNNKFTAGVWYHVMGVKHDNVLDVYINSSQVTSTRPTTPILSIKDSNSTLRIGAAGASASRLLGFIDEVRVYNRPLTPVEIRQLSNWAPGPNSYYKLDEMGGTSIYDFSGNGYAATALNGFNANSWVAGKFGGGVRFNSDFNQNLRLNPTSTLFPNVQSWSYGFWFKRNSDAALTTDEFLFSQRHTSYRGGSVFLRDFNDTLTCNVRHSGSHDYFTMDTLANIGTSWHYVSVTYDGNIYNCYLDGKLAVSTTGNQDAFDTSNTTVGGDLGGSTANATIDEVRTYTYPRTLPQIIEDMNGGHPIGGSPVGSQLIYTKLDEQNGNTINNSGFGGSPYNGTNSGAAWLTNTSCKVNGCLNFDSTTDTLSFGDVAFVDGIASMSASLWLNPQTLATNKMIVSKANNATHRVFSIKTDDSTNSELKVMVASTSSDTSNYCVTSGLGLSDSIWQQIIVTYDGTDAAANRIKVFKNAKQYTCSVTGTIPTTLTSSTTSNLKLGQGDDSTPTSLLTYIDEFKLYNTALTQDQILIDYNSGSSVNFGVGAPTPELSQMSDGAGNPPVVYLLFDENSGTTAKDVSGNGNNGSLNASLGFKPGKIGSALFIPPTPGNEEVDVSPSSTINDLSALTVEAWIFPFSAGGSSIGRVAVKGNNSTNGWIFRVSSISSIRFIGKFNGGTDVTFETAANTVPLNQWSHVAATWDGSTSFSNVKVYVNGISMTGATTANGVGTRDTDASENLFIGNSNGSHYFDGKIDEFKLYDYVRTQSQVSYDYNRGAPIGWWKFDECQGSTLYDASGNSFNGSWNGVSSGSQTSVGTCGTSSTAWGNGITGKFNSSLNFDGTDDYVQITDTASLRPNDGSWTISAWANPANSDQNKTIVSKSAGTTSYEEYSLQICGDETCNGAGQQLTADFIENNGTVMRTCTSTADVADGNLHHYVGVADKNADTVYLYMDGKQLETTCNHVSSWPTINNTNNLIIGAYNEDGTLQKYFTGKIDDVRVYNYPLSLIQIQKLYNDGSSVFFGPATGSP